MKKERGFLADGGFDWKPPSELGWRIVFSLAGTPKKRTELAKELGKPISRISEALSFFPAGLVYGQTKKPLVLNAELAGVVKILKVKHPTSALNLPRELAGSKLRVLDALNSGFKTVGEVCWATGLSKATVKRVLARFQKILWVFQRSKGEYFIRRGEDELHRACVIARSLTFQSSGLNEQLEWPGLEGKRVQPGAVQLHGRVVLCKNMRPLSKAFQPTGLSVFPKHGVSFVSDEVECVSQDHVVSKEEAFVHGVVLNEFDNRALGFCMLFLLENKLDLKKVEKLSHYFKCSETVRMMLRLIESGKAGENNVFDFDYWRKTENEPIYGAAIA